MINQLKKSIRKVVRRNFMRIPDGLRARLERRMFQIHLNGLPPDLEFKIAETKEELEQAFRLLHDSYVREGYMVPNESGLRVTPYHAIPSTTTLIAKKGDVVIGTVSILRQSRLKLPIQTAFDISKVVKPGEQAVEISSLAIDPKHRGLEAQLLFWLAKYVFIYCQIYFAVDYIFITVNPKQTDLYENIIMFQRLQSNIVQTYNFANGAPAVAEYIDMREYSNRLMATYWNQPAERNVYAFIMVHQLPRQFKFPKRAVYTVSDPVMTPELLNYFFNEKTSVFKNLDDLQLATLHEVYREFQEFKKVLPAAKGPSKHGARSLAVRYQVQCPATFRLNNEPQLDELEVIDVSSGGFLGKLPKPLKSGDRVRLSVKINNVDTVELEAVAVWSDDSVLTGFALTSDSPRWSQLIAHLEHDRNKAYPRAKLLKVV